MDIDEQIKIKKSYVDALEELKNKYKIKEIVDCDAYNIYIGEKECSKIYFEDITLDIESWDVSIYFQLTKKLNEHTNVHLDLEYFGTKNRGNLLYKLPDFSKIKMTKSCQDKLKTTLIKEIHNFNKENIKPFMLHKKSYVPEWLETYLIFS